MKNFINNLPSILKSFNVGDAYVFLDEKQYYIILKRGAHMPIKDWRYLENVIKDVCEVKCITLIAYDELEKNPFKKEFLKNSTLIRRAK